MKFTVITTGSYYDADEQDSHINFLKGLGFEFKEDNIWANRTTLRKTTSSVEINIDTLEDLMTWIGGRDIIISDGLIEIYDADDYRE